MWKEENILHSLNKMRNGDIDCILSDSGKSFVASFFIAMALIVAGIALVGVTNYIV